MKLPTKKSSTEIDLSKYIFQIYGEPKAGKSTFASNFPNAMFICTEPGTKFLSVYGGDHVHTSWEDLRDTVKNLVKEEHDFKTVVIDTVDNALQLCTDYVLRMHGVQHESDLPFGKGWAEVRKEFQRVLNALANNGFGIVFISHVKISDREEKGIKRPYADNTLNNTGKKYINGLSDFIFYCFDDDDGKKYFRTKANKNVNAGDRSGVLPEVMPTDYQVLEKTLKERWTHESD